jgi:hypothetical protein
MVRQIKVAYHPLVVDFLEQLTFALYEKGYFGFYDSACEYIDRMVAYISSNIQVKPFKKAPSYFNPFLSGHPLIGGLFLSVCHVRFLYEV